MTKNTTPEPYKRKTLHHLLLSCVRKIYPKK